ncbi:MAG: ABC transporter ATP-binding protein [Chloroflexota bacterium]
MTNQRSGGEAQNMMRMGPGGGGGRPTGETAKNTKATTNRLLEYLSPYRAQLIGVAILVLITTGLNLAGPILIGRAIDQHIMAANVTGLTSTVLTLLVVYTGAGIASLIQAVIMVSIGQSFVADIRATLFSHIQTLSMVYHDRHQVGDLMSRVSNDTEAINRVLSNGLIEFTTNVLMLGGIIIAMVILNWQLGLGTLIILPLMVFITGQITTRSRKAFRGVQRNLGGLNAVMEESITGLRVIKAFAREDDTLEKFEKINAQNRKVGIKADMITAALGPMFTTMSILTIAAVAWLGGWLALRGVVQIGVLATFIIYIRIFFRPMRGIAMLYNALQSALAGAERIFTVLDVEPAITDKPDANPLPDIKGEVTFQDVSFAYEADKPVLMDVDLHVEPGQTIALVGPTGAGKTTIISLLGRFYDVTKGSILVDQFDIRDVQQDSLRQQLGIVLQDTFLFSGTVIENIRYGRLNASDDEVFEAAKLANADWFIRRLPQGYQTQVSERGHNFSEGQRQLIAIARAVLADPRVLILDEATSSVDTRTEIQIQEAFLRLLEGRTAFVIAHRLSTIRNADLVLVVNDHRIIERGTHDELLAQKGFYHDLYMSQYRRFEMVAE